MPRPTFSPMLSPAPHTSNMVEIEERCGTLRSLAAEVVVGHGEFMTKTFFSEQQMCVSSSLRVLEDADATFMVSVATIQINPVSAATLEPPRGNRTAEEHQHIHDNRIQLLKRTHTAEELDVVVGKSQVRNGTTRTPARAWTRWKAAESGKTAFVGLKKEVVHCAFVPCVTYDHAVNEAARARTFPGLFNVRVVMVCPAAGADCSLVETINGCTIWRVPATARHA